MGGVGSGRHWKGGKDTTSDYRSLDVRRLQRGGLLNPGQSFNWRWSRNGEEIASIRVRTEFDKLILDYRHRSGGGEWQPMEYLVYLNWTPCTFGGRRAWFRCPAKGCGRRVALLYGGAIFACRHCYRLVYDSQRERVPDRAIRRADAIRRRLGWPPGILNAPGWKPKGMHWSTFERLRREHDANAEISLAGIAVKLGLLDRKLIGIWNDLNVGR
jgi:hypothetical protein